MIFDPNNLKLLDNVAALNSTSETFDCLPWETNRPRRAVAALNSTSETFDLSAMDRVTLIVDYKSGVSAGAVVLEVAPFAGYAGTWATLLTAAFGGTAPIAVRAQGDVCARVGRVRISTALTGGNCDAYVKRAIVGKGDS